MPGIDANGFSLLRLSDIQDEINTAYQGIFGPQVNLVTPSILSQLRDLYAEREANIWEGQQAVYSSQYPDSSQGVALDNVVSLTGIKRLGATQSVAASCYLFGTIGTPIAANSQFSVLGSPTSIFTNANAVTLGAGTSEVQLLQFSAVPVSGTWTIQSFNQISSSLAFNASAATIQGVLNTVLADIVAGGSCTVTGNYTSGFTITYTGSCGNQPWPLAIIASTLVTSGSVVVVPTVTETTAGVAQAIVTLTCLSTGPIVAPAFSLVNIVTPISGLTGVFNQFDATPGRNVESDAQLKLRRVQALASGGSATVEAIRSAILNLNGITTCLVFENPYYIVDNTGRPPKCFEAVVAGSYAAADVGNAIWQKKAAGMQAYGNSAVTITDSMGYTHSIGYSTFTGTNIYCIVNLTRDLTGEVPGFPSNGVALVKAALSTFVGMLGGGRDVVPNPGLQSSLEPIPGIYNVQILIGTAPSPTLSLPIPIGAEFNAVLETSNITVNILN